MNTYEKEIRKNGIRFTVAIVSVLLVITMMIVAAIKLDNQHIKEYNNGHCSCGGEYHLVAVHYHAYYECDKCGHTIVLPKLMK